MAIDIKQKDYTEIWGTNGSKLCVKVTIENKRIREVMIRKDDGVMFNSFHLSGLSALQGLYDIIGETLTETEEHLSNGN